MNSQSRKIEIMTYTRLANIGNRYQSWLKALEFYSEDIDILEKRLSEVAIINTGDDVGKGVEKFQDLFVSSHQNIHRVKEKIQRFAHDLKIEVEKHAGHVDTNHLFEQKELQNSMDEFEAEIATIRKDFNNFLAKWM